jgi:hypothetical protein
MSYTASKQKLFFVALEPGLACCAMGEIRFNGERWRALCYQDGERYEAPTPGRQTRGQVERWLAQKWANRTSDELHWLVDECPGMGLAGERRAA